MLRCSPERFQNADRVLRSLFPTFNNTQDESDFRHLVRALAADADAFITRDASLLDRADEVFETCGLSVLRPAELIARIDVVEHEREYQRKFVAGTRLVLQERISSADNLVLATIQREGENQRTLMATLNRYFADPHRFACHKIIGASENILAFFAVERDGGVSRIPLLRICPKRQAGTLACAPFSHRWYGKVLLPMPKC